MAFPPPLNCTPNATEPLLLIFTEPISELTTREPVSVMSVSFTPAMRCKVVPFVTKTESRGVPWLSFPRKANMRNILRWVRGKTDYRQENSD